MFSLIEKYIIEVLLKNQTIRKLNTTQLSYNVTNLKKFTNYAFYVKAVNQIGESPAVDIKKQTLADCKHL